tara:strand:+ start:964 stop:1854 length:891 start_codon:yes stop_codon:yes gene_type:complete
MKRLLQSCYHSDNPRKMRKRDLEPLKRFYNLNCKYKQDIWNGIKEKCKPSERCENSNDPITLQNIDEIPCKRLFEWEQDGKRFAADILSLKQMIDNEQYINPWAIDYATGILESEDTKTYVKRFDMRKCRGLISKLINAYEEVISTSNFAQEEEVLEVPELTKLRFTIEHFGEKIKQSVEHAENANGQGMYTVSAMNFIETLVNFQCMRFLRDVCIICLNQMFMSNPQSISCIVFEQLAFSYQMNHDLYKENFATDPVLNLKHFINLLNNIEQVCTDLEKLEILRLVFITIDDLIK